MEDSPCAKYNNYTDYTDYCCMNRYKIYYVNDYLIKKAVKLIYSIRIALSLILVTYLMQLVFKLI